MNIPTALICAPEHRKAMEEIARNRFGVGWKPRRIYNSGKYPSISPRQAMLQSATDWDMARKEAMVHFMDEERHRPEHDRWIERKKEAQFQHFVDQTLKGIADSYGVPMEIMMDEGKELYENNKPTGAIPLSEKENNMDINTVKKDDEVLIKTAGLQNRCRARTNGVIASSGKISRDGATGAVTAIDYSDSSLCVEVNGCALWYDITWIRAPIKSTAPDTDKDPEGWDDDQEYLDAKAMSDMSDESVSNLEGKAKRLEEEIQVLRNSQVEDLTTPGLTDVRMYLDGRVSISGCNHTREEARALARKILRYQPPKIADNPE